MRLRVVVTATLLFLTATCMAQELQLLAAAPKYTCGDGYALYGDYCYRVYSNPLSNFDEAVEICRLDGGHLASIHDAFDNINIQNLKASGLLIGIQYDNNSDSYFWSDGTPVDFLGFAKDYAQTRKFYGYCAKNVKGKWKSIQCDTDRSEFVCSKKADILTAARNDRCPDATEYTTPGVVVSPGYPVPYSLTTKLPKTGCQYQLLAENKHFVEIAFEEFDISDGAFVVYKTENIDQKTEIARVGKDLVGKKIIVDYNRVLLHIVNSTTGTWKITWTALTPQSVGQVRNNACPIADQIIVVPDTIHSPGYPGEFLFSEETATAGCSYAILAEGRYVLLEFEEVRFAQNTGWIDVYRGWTKRDRVYRADNNNEKRVLVVDSSRVLLHVHSAPHGKFRIRWSAVNACKPGWSYFNFSCYFSAADKVTQYEARRRCEQEGAELASVLSLEENDYLISITKSQGSRKVAWAGLTKTDKWGWTDGSPLSFLNWCHMVGWTDPDNCCAPGPTSCGIVWFDPPAIPFSCFGDTGCLNEYPYICKQKVYTFFKT